MTRAKLLFAGFGLAAFFLYLSAPASAASSADIITSFKSDQTLSRNDPQGELHIVEDITVKYTSESHGMVRAIPGRYKNHSTQLKINSVTSKTGAPSQYSTYSSNSNTVLKIGSPDVFVNGTQEYRIDYSLKNVITFYKDHDELYWDVNGDQWPQMFESVSVNLHLPTGLKEYYQPVCFAGGYGAKGKNCIVNSQGNTLNISTVSPLGPNQTLTYIAGFEKGYFSPHKWYDSIGEYALQIIGFVGPVLILGIGGFALWWRRGRDPRGSGIIVPQYEPPDGMKPAEVGQLIDFKVDNRDITAVIIDLAVNGYIKIIEEKQNRLLGKDKLSYKLRVTKADLTNLDPDGQLLMSRIFEAVEIGKEADISKSKNKLYTVAETLRKNVNERLNKNGYQVDSKTTVQKTKRMVLAAIGLCGLGYIFVKIVGGWTGAGIFVGFLIALPFLLALKARTAKGVAAKEQIQGLKLYLETAEKDRISKLQSPNAPYASNATEPVKTVELFEKLLPYAVVLGVETEWAKQFEALYTTPPDWYSGNWSTFNAYYLASSLNSGVGSAVNTSFSAPSSSGSSGLSGGGGFSGGGGGGGGGGTW